MDSSLEELQARLDKIGSHVSINAGNYTSTISISSLEKYQSLRLMNKISLGLKNRCLKVWYINIKNLVG